METAFELISNLRSVPHLQHSGYRLFRNSASEVRLVVYNCFNY